MSKTLTVTEVAGRLQVCDETVYRLCRTKKLVAVRVGNALRITEEDLQDFIEKNREK
jgi:excisionase family DNA binding protein